MKVLVAGYMHKNIIYAMDQAYQYILNTKPKRKSLYPSFIIHNSAI